MKAFGAFVTETFAWLHSAPPLAVLVIAPSAEVGMTAVAPISEAVICKILGVVGSGPKVEAIRPVCPFRVSRPFLIYRPTVAYACSRRKAGARGS